MANKFVLIGSGLAGGLLAAYLGRRGYEVELYERRADPREGNIVGGRSINLALSTMPNRAIYIFHRTTAIRRSSLIRSDAPRSIPL